MKKFQLAAALLSVFLLGSSSRNRATVEETIELRNEKMLETRLDLGAGELKLGPKVSGGRLFEGRFSYRPRDFKPEFHYTASRQTGFLTLETRSLKKFLTDRDPKNEWEISFSPEVLHTFDLDLGACEAELDFSGLPVKELKLDLGAGECRVFFEKPNPVEMKKLEIAAGASELTVKGLGNANFNQMKFDGGLGEFRLDFSGDFTGDRQADVSVGLGEIELLFPPGLGVRVYKESGLSSVDFGPDFEEVSDGVWETGNYRRAKSRLLVKLSVGLGSAELRRAERCPPPQLTPTSCGRSYAGCGSGSRLPQIPPCQIAGALCRIPDG
jgi:hypothetical protein